MHARRFLAVIASTALVLGFTAPSQALTSPSPLAMPKSMAALGDSITIAYDIKSLLLADPTYSWSTGTQATVNSLYTRLDAKNGPDTIAKANWAVSGAKIGDLAGQAGKVATGTDLVTVLMGANDACTSTEAGMTSVKDFGARADAAMTALSARSVDQIVIASIPDIYNLWDVGRASSSARFVWGLYRICQSMLKSPTSQLTADKARRDNVRARVDLFNAELARACAQVSSTSPMTACRFDDNKVNDTSFSLSDLSRVDYFHPSAAGQAKIASTVYEKVGLP